MATERLILAMALAIAAAAPGVAAAADRTYRIEFNDGTVTPRRIEVPAGARIELELHNVGKTPAEFESLTLHKEKILAPDSSTSMVIKGLDPGEYEFFDDFHPGAPPAVLVAK